MPAIFSTQLEQGNKYILPNIFALTGSEVAPVVWIEGIAGGGEGRASSGEGSKVWLL